MCFFERFELDFWGQIANGCLIRRTKKDHLNLPHHKELILTITMREHQQQLYRMVKNSEHSNRASDCSKIASHPKLFDPSQPIVGSSGMQKFVFFCQNHFLSVFLGKFDVLIKLLEQIVIEKKEKAVVFTIFKDVIGFIGEILKEKKIKYVTLTGDDSATERQMNIALFQDPELWIECPVMLCTFPVGGQGVTLTAANHAILYNPPSSHALTVQATDR